MLFCLVLVLTSLLDPLCVFILGTVCRKPSAIAVSTVITDILFAPSCALFPCVLRLSFSPAVTISSVEYLLWLLRHFSSLTPLPQSFGGSSSLLCLSKVGSLQGSILYLFVFSSHTFLSLSLQQEAVERRHPAWESRT